MYTNPFFAFKNTLKFVPGKDNEPTGYNNVFIDF